MCSYIESIGSFTAGDDAAAMAMRGVGQAAVKLRRQEAAPHYATGDESGIGA
jgi:hypothetical protein